jgi:hypothetical protein
MDWDELIDICANIILRLLCHSSSSFNGPTSTKAFAIQHLSHTHLVINQYITVVLLFARQLLKDMMAATSSSSPQTTAQPSTNNTNTLNLTMEQRISIVRHHFTQKGYRVHSGLQFGCELVLYADSPGRVHSDFCVHVVGVGELSVTIVGLCFVCLFDISSGKNTSGVSDERPHAMIDFYMLSTSFVILQMVD